MTKSGINMVAVKRNNRAHILKYIIHTGPISKKDIAEELGLTPAAVTLLCNELLEQGLLVECGILPGEAGKAGRKKVSIDINSEYGYIYGINIDSEKTNISVCNIKGEKLVLRSIATDGSISPDKFLEKLVRLCRRMSQDLQIPEDKILGAGIGVPGDVDPEKGISRNAYGIWNEEVPVRKIMEDLLGKPVTVENNVNAYAAAEILFGKGKNCTSFFLVKWGPGIGAAVILNREVYEGQATRTVEFGHMIVKPNGRPCACGKHGCLEAYLSYTYLAKAIGDFNMKAFDKTIDRIPEESIHLFAQNIVNAAMLLGIHEIVLSGQMFGGDKTCERVEKACLELSEGSTELSISKSNLISEEEFIGPVAYFIEQKYIQA